MIFDDDYEDEDDSERLSVWEAAEIWSSNGKDEDYMFGYTEEELEKREDGRWEGRIVVGHKANGDSIFRYVYAPTQKELSTKLRRHIDAPT